MSLYLLCELYLHFCYIWFQSIGTQRTSGSHEHPKNNLHSISSTCAWEVSTALGETSAQHGSDCHHTVTSKVSVQSNPVLDDRRVSGRDGTQMSLSTFLQHIRMSQPHLGLLWKFNERVKYAIHYSRGKGRGQQVNLWIIRPNRGVCCDSRLFSKMHQILSVPFYILSPPTSLFFEVSCQLPILRKGTFPLKLCSLQESWRVDSICWALKSPSKTKFGVFTIPLFFKSFKPAKRNHEPNTLKPHLVAGCFPSSRTFGTRGQNMAEQKASKVSKLHEREGIRLSQS